MQPGSPLSSEHAQWTVTTVATRRSHIVLHPSLHCLGILHPPSSASRKPWAWSPTNDRRTRRPVPELRGVIAHGGNRQIGPPRHPAPGDGRIGRQPGASGRVSRGLGPMPVLSFAQVARPTFLATLLLLLSKRRTSLPRRILRPKSPLPCFSAVLGSARPCSKQ